MKVLGVLLLALSLTMGGHPVPAHDPRTIPTVGLLLFESPGGISQDGKAFREGMAALGWVEGRSVNLEVRFAAGSQERLEAMARELVAKRVVAIACVGTQATRTARLATAAIPIIMVGVGDPLAAGFVKSLARPGTNVTGTSLMLTETGTKQVEVLREFIPGLRRLAVLQMRAAEHGESVALLQQYSSAQEIDVRFYAVAEIGELARAFERIVAERNEALLMLANPQFDAMRGSVAALATAHKLPSIGAFRQHAEAGFLMAYAASLPEAHRRAAFHLHRVLKGANPAELPVEQPSKFELVINVKTARALGITIPLLLLTRADEVIE
jgi:putative ABC transport system substrate-binding protein